MKYQYYLVKNNSLIPIISKSQVHVGSIVAVVGKGNAIYFRIDKLLPDKNVDNWFKGRSDITSLYVLKNPALRQYFFGEGLSGLSDEELSGFFHSIGHVFSSAAHAVGHVIGQVAHGAGHVFEQVVKHPALLAIPAVAVAAPHVIPAVGSVVGAGSVSATGVAGAGAGVTGAATIGTATATTAASSILPAAASVLSTAGKVVAANIASGLASRILSVPPEQVIAQGAQDLGYTPDVANQVYNQSREYAQQNNIQSNLPYQQTAAYVAAHWDQFSTLYRTPEEAITDLLIKRSGIPPRPGDNPSNIVNAGLLEQVKPYLPYIGIGLATLLLLMPKHKEESKILVL